MVESRIRGRRRKVGGFTFGIAQAQWATEGAGVAHLMDAGLRYKDAFGTKPQKTILRIFNPHEETCFEVVTFRMDVDYTGTIDIYRNMATTGSFLEILKAELHKRADRRHGLSEPTDEQKELLYTEMQRGSTGLYPVGYDSGEDY